MRKVYLLLTLICISVFACKKAENSGPIKLLPGFIVNGITDVTVEKDSVNFLSISVEMKKGEQEPVTLSASGLPAGVTVTFTPESGTPDFTAFATFRTSLSSVSGTYPIKLVVTGRSGARSYDMNLIIKPISECGNRTVGQYLADDFCDNFGAMTYNTFVSPSGTNNRIFINNLGNTFSGGAFANLNCDEGTLVIPQQTFLGSGTISGTGTFSSTQMDINYSFDFGGGSTPVTCHVVMTKQ
jgi:hypothetical protein